MYFYYFNIYKQARRPRNFIPRERVSGDAPPKRQAVCQKEGPALEMKAKCWRKFENRKHENERKKEKKSLHNLFTAKSSEMISLSVVHLLSG